MPHVRRGAKPILSDRRAARRSRRPSRLNPSGRALFGTRFVEPLDRSSATLVATLLPIIRKERGAEPLRWSNRLSDPTIEHPRDAIIKVTSCAICGSDLHLFHNLIPAMVPGDIMGHEAMGEVVDVGRAAKGKLKKGDRIVIPFTIVCSECEQCRRGNVSVCEQTNRRKDLGDKVFGHATAGLFVITHKVDLTQGPEMYTTFRDKADGCIKVMLQP